MRPPSRIVSIIFFLGIMCCTCTHEQIRPPSETVPIEYEFLVPSELSITDKKFESKPDGSTIVTIIAICKNPPHWKGAGFQSAVVTIKYFILSENERTAAQGKADRFVKEWMGFHAVTKNNSRHSWTHHPHIYPHVLKGKLVLQLIDMPMPPETASPYISLYFGIGYIIGENGYIIVDIESAKQSPEIITAWFNHTAAVYTRMQQ